MDAVDTAQECLHSIKEKNQKVLIIKLDLRKSYDTISWDVLHLILTKVGFEQSTTRWIMSCITSVSYAILINGEPSMFFQRGKGLRQGCPLSPLLFILVMEILRILIKKAKEAGTLIGIQVSKFTKILHLLFVDDVLILTKDCLKEWTMISDLLKVFQKSTRLQINEGKSTFFSAGLEETDLFIFKDLFSFWT